MIQRYPAQIVAGMGARYIDGVFFNVFGVFSIAYLTGQLKVPRTSALLGVTAAALVMCAFIPLFGRLSDRIGRPRVYFWGSVATAISASPFATAVLVRQVTACVREGSPVHVRIIRSGSKVGL